MEEEEPNPLLADDPPSPTLEEEVTFDAGILTQDERQAHDRETGREFVLDEEFVEEFQRQDEIQKQIRAGKSLRQYSEEIEDKLYEVEEQLIEDYVRKGDDYVDLHRQLQECEDVFSHFEHILSKFHAKFSTLTDKIAEFQDASHILSFKLANSKSAQKRVDKVYEQFGKPRQQLAALKKNPLNVGHLLLIESQEKSLALDENLKWSDTKFFKAIHEDVTVMSRFALRRIVDVLLKRFSSLSSGRSWEERRTPLLKYSYFNTFLRSHDIARFQSVQSSYVSYSAKYYHSAVESYVKRMMKLVVKVRGELIIEKMKRGGLFSRRRKQPAEMPVRQLFYARERTRVLQEDFLPPQPSHGQQWLLEVIFKSIHMLLMRYSLSEHSFIMSFFYSGEDELQDATARIGSSIFGTSFKVIIAAVQKSLKGTKDVVGLYLLIKIAQHFKEKNCSFLKHYFNDMRIVLWPLFKRLLDENVRSVKTAFEVNPFQTMCDAEKKNHVVARRYSQLLASILSLSSQEERLILAQNLNMLRNAVKVFLVAISKNKRCFATNKPKLVFLINSYDVILKEMLDHQLMDCEEWKWFFAELVMHVDRLKSIIVEDCFPDLVRFVEKTKQLVSRTAPASDNLSRVKGGEMQQLARDFRGNWKSALEGIRDIVERSFRNFETGRNILSQVFDHLLHFYNEFKSIVMCCYGKKGCPFQSFIVGTQTIQYEFHKYLHGAAGKGTPSAAKGGV